MLHLPAESLSDSSPSKKVVLMLFHNNLRVNDNATLSRNNQEHLLLFYTSFLADITEKKTWSNAYAYDDMGLARQQFLTERLTALYL